MLRSSRVKLFKQVKISGKWTLAVALFDSKGRSGVRTAEALRGTVHAVLSNKQSYQSCG
jgi:hypothetical protein